MDTCGPARALAGLFPQAGSARAVAIAARPLPILG